MTRVCVSSGWRALARGLLGRNVAVRNSSPRGWGAATLRSAVTAQRSVAGAITALGAVMALLVLGVLVSACGDDDQGGSPPSEGRGASDGATAPSTEPPGTEPVEVRVYIEDLLVRLDEVTDEIVRDPSVVLDPESELVQEFKALYAPGSDGLSGGLRAFRQSAEEGTRLEPVNSDHTIETALTGDIETVDEEHVRFPVCSTMTHRELDGDGVVVEHIPRLAQPGEGFAVRLDGEWRLERIDVFTNTICGESAP